MSVIVGIDFGTSNSAVSALVDGQHQVLADEKGQRLTPSVVAFGKDNQVLIGADAKLQSFKNPQRTVHSIKRLIGRKIYSAETEKSKVLLPYALVESENQNVAVQIDDKLYTPQEIAALILRRMKTIAEAALKTTVTQTVITVPAYFNDSQRQTTIEACKLAGLEVVRAINEPTAAALAYGFGKNLNETIAVYDLGGGTFDISILRLKNGVFEVIATAGDTFLGGDDFDDRVIDLMSEEFLKKWNVDLRSLPGALPLLRANAEKTKRRLSYAERSDIYIPGVVKKDDKDIDLHFTLSREQMKTKCWDLIQRTFKVCDEALSAAGVRTQDLDAVILVGGPTKMPLIQEAVGDYFGKTPLNDLNPDEVVSVGASIQASSLQADSKQKKALLLDVTPLDLGVATVDGFIETLIEKNSPIPAKTSKAFTTARDLQEAVIIQVYQGKNRRVESSHLLGEFELKGLKRTKAGELEIDVDFSINTDGVVQVSARDKETGIHKDIAVRLSAVMGEEKLQESHERIQQHREVQLKAEPKDTLKVLVFLPSGSGVGSTYQEGTVKNFDPLAPSFTLIPESGGKEIEIERKRVGWVAVIDDFANIPRYLQALCMMPEPTPNPKEGQMYQFTLFNGQQIFGMSDLPSKKEEGFWVKPFFPQDRLPGKVFVYSNKVKDSEPLKVAG